MGRKTSTDTLAKLFVAFLENRTWKQKDLERRCGVSTRSIRKCLLDMQEAGIRLESEVDHPHVYWSVPKGWFPGATAGLEGIDALEVARLIARLPRSKTRARVLAKLIHPAFGDSAKPSSENLDADTDSQDEVLNMLEEAARTSTPVRMGYFSASRGEQSLRTVSMQRIVYDNRRLRFIAFCHTTQKLKWFRADRVTSPRVYPSERHIAVDTQKVDALIAESLDGFHGGGNVMTCSFFVSAAEVRWVGRNLPLSASTSSYAIDHTSEGATVSVKTSAFDVLARFIVGLGGSAHVIAPSALRERVSSLAKAALLANGQSMLNEGAARAIRPAGYVAKQTQDDA